MGQPDAGVLFVVATPIGHLGDLSHRGSEVLKQVQIVAAEDTRRTRVLLEHIAHRSPELVSLHEHNEEKVAGRLIERLLGGDDVALVSDAGTPLLNDPGFVLIRLAHDAGITTVPVPGPCAITTALSVCPLPCQPFRYVGFLPAKSNARRQRLSEWLAQSDALVFLESPRRILGALQDIASVSDRRVMLGRELTKQYETILAGTPAELIEALGEHPKGEFTGVIESGDVPQGSFEQRAVLEALLLELPPARAAKVAAQICSVKKSEMYDLAMQLSASQIDS